MLSAVSRNQGPRAWHIVDALKLAYGVMMLGGVKVFSTADTKVQVEVLRGVVTGVRWDGGRLLGKQCPEEGPHHGRKS